MWLRDDSIAEREARAILAETEPAEGYHRVSHAAQTVPSGHGSRMAYLSLAEALAAFVEG